MRRFGLLIMTLALGVGWSATSVTAQDPARKLVSPVRGEAELEITTPATKVGTSEVVTTFRVKNVAKGPIAGFKVQESWFKAGEAMAGDSYRHARPLQMNEVIEVTLNVPRARVVGATNRYDFSHANGTIKTKPVKTLPAPPKPPK